MSSSAAPLCPACGATAARGAGAMVDCSACGLRFAKDPRAGDASWYEDSEVYAERHDVSRPPPLRRLDWAGERFFSLCSKPGSLLDLGCSSGDFLSHAKERGWRVRGRELTASGAFLARLRHGDGAIERADASAPWSEELLSSFDAATAFELFEHLHDPLAALRHLLQVVRPGGRVVFSVPRVDRRPALFDPVVDAPPHHLSLWTSAACERLLERAGLEERAVEARPLRPQDLYLHRAWARERRGLGSGSRLIDLAARASCVARVAARRAVGLAAGHTLLASGLRP